MKTPFYVVRKGRVIEVFIDDCDSHGRYLLLDDDGNPIIAGSVELHATKTQALAAMLGTRFPGPG